MIDAKAIADFEPEALCVNPMAACQPLGAIYASLGIHACMPHSHGSSGCSRYQKAMLQRHFRQTFKITSSVLKESAAIFGGEKQLSESIANIFRVYDPQVIAVHTTCLSETIGDDLKSCLYGCPVPGGKHLIHCSTPSYSGSHISGFAAMTAATVEQLSRRGEAPNHKLCIMPGFVNPGDMSEIKRFCALMAVDSIMFPDTCGIFGQRGNDGLKSYPAGGTPVASIIDMGNCSRTLALGKYASEGAALGLKKQCGVPAEIMDLPIGIEATDRLVMELRRLGWPDVAPELQAERELVIDAILDAHPWFYDKRLALFGDPDTIIPLAQFLASIGMIPCLAMTGTPGAYFEERMKQVFSRYGIDGIARSSADLFQLQQHMQRHPVDLLIGGTHGQLLARAENIPLVRVGFPVMDRHLHSLQPIVGYRGALRLLEMILNGIMEKLEREHPEKDLVFL